MSYAAAFEQIFDRIFGAGRLKPRLAKVHITLGRSLWMCYSPDGRVGYGLTPKMAYGAWSALQKGAPA